MSDHEIMPYVELLAAIIERARADAEGKTLGETVYTAVQAQHDARQWLETELDCWCEWAAHGILYSRHRGV